jgi:hypothetical protein
MNERIKDLVTELVEADTLLRKELKKLRNAKKGCDCDNQESSLFIELSGDTPCIVDRCLNCGGTISEQEWE